MLLRWRRDTKLSSNLTISLQFTWNKQGAQQEHIMCQLAASRLLYISKTLYQSFLQVIALQFSDNDIILQITGNIDSTGQGRHLS